MLTKNSWIKAGLVNGAFGTVTAIVYSKNEKPLKQPLYILVQFDKYFVPTLEEDSVPIVRENATWSKNIIDFHRNQFPLILLYASSIHKGQGLTMPKVILDIGNKEFICGVRYVALTRARSLKDKIFKPFFQMERLLSIGVSGVMKDRVKFITSFSKNVTN